MAGFSLNLKLKSSKLKLTNLHRKKVNNTIVAGTSGVIKEVVNLSTGGIKYTVFTDGMYYDITPRSYDTNKKKTIYVKDEKGKWISYTRAPIEDRRAMPPEYLPFKPEITVRGDIVKLSDNIDYFDIKSIDNK